MATKIKRGEEGVGKEGGTTLYSLRRLPQGGRTNREAGSGRRLRGRYVKRPRAVSMLRVAPGYGMYVSVWRRGSQWKRPRCVDRSCCKKSGITSLCDAVASRTVGWIGRRVPKVAGSIRLALLNLRHLLIPETSPEATMRMLRRALMVLNLDICRTSPPRRPTIAPRQSSRPICEDCPHRFCVGYRFEPSRKQSPPDQLDLSLVEGDLSTSPPSLARAAAWRGRAWWGVREPEAYIWRRARARATSACGWPRTAVVATYDDVVLLAAQRTVRPYRQLPATPPVCVGCSGFARLRSRRPCVWAIMWRGQPRRVEWAAGARPAAPAAAMGAEALAAAAAAARRRAQAAAADAAVLEAAARVAASDAAEEAVAMAAMVAAAPRRMSAAGAGAASGHAWNASPPAMGGTARWRCQHCSSRDMFCHRPGPGGVGTLCNGMVSSKRGVWGERAVGSLRRFVCVGGVGGGGQGM